MKILWLNWRDIKHPLAGGAEVYTHEVARRLAADGYEVVLFSSRPPGLPREEVIDGYRVVRAGGRLGVYLAARRFYRRLASGGWRPDVVIDEINTIPFMTPLYVREPIVVLIHQLCRDCWRYAVHPLAEKPGWLLERLLHRPYVRAARDGHVAAVVTVSDSTRKDLIQLGYPGERIAVALNGLDWSLYRGCDKLAERKEPLVTYLGRIASYKRVDELVRAWRLVEERHPDARLVVAGRPDARYLERLRRLAERLGLRRAEFRVNLSTGEKLRLLAGSLVVVYTSAREGWGRTLIEAAACHTPGVAYDVPGLRDAARFLSPAVRLVKPGDLRALAEEISWFLDHPEEARRLGEHAYRAAKQLGWDRTTAVFKQILSKIAP